MPERPWDPYDRDCPSRRLLSRIGDKWTVLVISALSDGPLRYSELRRRIDGVSQKMLTHTLRELETDGILSRTVTNTSPPRVDYALTDVGQTLQEPLQALIDWAVVNMTRVREFRAG